MPRKACTFRQTDITRAAGGVMAAGMTVARFEFKPDGSFIVVAGNGATEQDVNEWDSDLAA